MTDVVLYDIAGGVATITLNRPDSLNALNEELAMSLQKALADAGGDRTVRCVVITGAGRGFCSGADLSGLPQGERIPVSDILRRWYHPIVLPITQMEKPVIAAVNGVAAGAGASLAFACDFRIASEKARFIQAFIKIGLLPDSGSNYFLPRLVGFAKAMELSMTGDAVDAAEALRIGLVNEVAPLEGFAEAVASYAKPFASGPTRAYGLARKALHFGATNPLHETLEYEADAQELLAGTADVAEGVLSFLQKRAPTFEGR